MVGGAFCGVFGDGRRVERWLVNVAQKRSVD